MPRKPRKTRHNWYKKANNRRFLRGGNPDLLQQVRDGALLMHNTSDGEGFSLYGPAKITCGGCGNVFKVPRSAAPYRAFCSNDCRRAAGWTPPPGSERRTKEKKSYYAPKLKPHPLAIANKVLLELSKPDLTVRQAARLRGKLATQMEAILDEAVGVVMGTSGTTWSPTQARVFGILVGKVLPDLSASHVINETRTTRPEDMSIEELQNLIDSARMMALEAPGDHDGVVIDQPQELEYDRRPPLEDPDPVPRDPE
jgi:hypothetical protein